MHKELNFSPRQFLIVITVLIIFMQFMNIFRIALVFNSTIYTLPLLFFTIVGGVLLTISYAKTPLRMSYREVFLCTFPFLMIPWGLNNNPLDRHIFSDPVIVALCFFTIAAFRTGKIQNLDWAKIARWLHYSLLAFLGLTFVLKALNVHLFSIAKTSIFFTLPFFYFLFTKQKGNLLLAALAILLATKRSLIIGIPFALFIFMVANRSFRMTTKTFFLGIAILLLPIVGTLFSFPEFASQLPGHLSDLFYKLTIINPMSPNFNISENYRVAEVAHSFEQAFTGPIYYLLGQGPGFAYDVFKADGTIWFEKVYNSHFTYSSIATKYGIIYALILISYLVYVFRTSLKSLRLFPNEPIHKVFFCFFLCSFFETLTSYSLFINLLNSAIVGQILFYEKEVWNTTR